MRLVGLTGGIASGKSSVGKVLQEEGVVVISCDAAAKQVVEQGCPGYKKVVNKFGKDILLPSGEIDRQKLGAVVFGSRENREALNSCIHPEIAKIVRRRLILEFLKGTQLVILDIPLLFESCNIRPYMHSVILVYCTPEQQKERLMDRNDFTEEAANARINSQWSIEEKKELADHVIDNTGLFLETEAQTKELLAELRKGILPVRNILLLLFFFTAAVILYNF